MATDSDFIHLHTHTEFSILDGFGHMDEYLSEVVRLGQAGMGSSDHGNVAGIYQLIMKAKALGITPVPGCEFYMAPKNPEGARSKSPVFYGPNGQKAPDYDVASNGAYTHQTIWAVNNEGLRNLFRLSSMSNEPAHTYSKPRIDFEMLAEHSEGLVVATGCPSSEVSTRFLLNQDKEAYEHANRLKEVFGDRLFVEIMEHGMGNPIERLLLPKQMELSRKMGIPLLATNDAHYTHKTDVVHHEEMLCSQSGSTMSDKTWDQGGPRFAFDGNQFYLKSAQEMAEVFPVNDYKNALSNTLLIAEMAQGISLEFDPTLKPKSIIPAGFVGEVDYFRHLIDVGFEHRYGAHDREIQAEAKARIENEFKVIHSSNYIGYFLTVYDYLKYARDTFSTRDEAGEILALAIGVGRGSVGGSIIAYLLDISELDPIRHDLLFARFLSAGRGDTFEVVYDDGSRETVIVSEERKVTSGENEGLRYIHELRVGDTVELDFELELANPAEVVFQEVEADDNEEPISDGVEQKPAASEAVVTSPAKETLIPEEFSPEPEVAAVAPEPVKRGRNDPPPPAKVIVSGPPAEDQLSDPLAIPF